MNVKKTVLLLLSLYCISFSARGNENDLLIEAESFENTGAWVIDQQFAFEMGSPYLLAHGLGKPVANAKTTAHFAEIGNYHVWARTKNWAAGDWTAPGRFRLVVDGETLETELGTLEDWAWQYAGVVDIKTENVEIELNDLTGFEGRCDAVFFSKENVSPPNEAKKLSEWRSNTGVPKTIVSRSFDFVVVGGGLAGCAAAIAAAEQGLQVALVHDRPTLGGNASAEVRVHTLGVYGDFERIIRLIDTEHYPNGSSQAKTDEEKRMTNIAAYSNIHLFLNYQAFNAVSESEIISYVDARHTSSGEQIRFVAPLFADCT
ncbi:MAG: FAD-dependent oxidoreductase, partial [Prevotellaceae bacterium]|nr:FAD-dependent oxidoreductase [Prevotellaceae bacterium]